MNRLKRFLLRMVSPPGWLTALISIPSFALVIYVLTSGIEDAPLAYVSYAASAYALLLVALRAPDAAEALRRYVHGHPLVQRVRNLQQVQHILTDPMYRAELALYAGLAVNLAYAALKLVSGIAYHSVWFGAMAGYYLLLSALRFALLHHTRRSPVGRDPLSEWRRYRLCGVLLLMMNQALLAVVALVVYRNSGAEYPGYLIYIMAMYAFYAVINAVRNVVRFRACGSPVLSAAKAVSLIAAMVSLLSLETAMLTQFGSAGDPHFRRWMTGCTGFAVCAIVLAMAVYMIAHSTRQIKRLNQGEQSI